MINETEGSPKDFVKISYIGIRFKRVLRDRKDTSVSTIVEVSLCPQNIN